MDAFLPKVRQRAKQTAFTLIELLVVIAVIAVLAALLFPVFAKVREKGRQTACLSNMRQMSGALLQYVQDSGEAMPRSWYGPPISDGPSDPAQGKYKWMDAVFPYVQNTQVFTCPSDGTSSQPYIYYRNLPAPSDSNYGSYRSNFAYYSAGPYTPPFADFNRPVALSAIQAPADTVWIVEGDADQNIYDMAWSSTTQTLAITSDSPRRLQNQTDIKHQHVTERHTGFTNVLWCDGHVKAVTLDTLAATHTMPNGDKILYHFTIEAD